jgi:hypothetical protein
MLAPVLFTLILFTSSDAAHPPVPRTDTTHPHTPHTTPQPTHPPKTKLLQTATVTRQAPLLQHQLDKTVLNVDHQLTGAGTNVLELLRQLPGVQVTADGQITLNGRSGVTILIDGKPTYLSVEDLAAQLTSTPSAAIQQLELMTNPSAKYDAEGSGGIINIIRKRNRAPGLNGNFTATGGQGYFPDYSASLLVGYKTDRYNLYINDNYNYNKSILGANATTDILDGTTLLTEQTATNYRIATSRSNNAAIGLDWYWSKHTTLSLTGNIGFRTGTELVTSNMTIADGSMTKTGTESFSGLYIDHPRNQTTGIQLTHQIDTLGQEWSFNADYSEFYYHPSQNNNSISAGPSGDFTDGSNVYLRQSRDLNVFGARLDYTRPLPGNGKLEAGLSSSYVKTTNNSSYYDQINNEDIIDSTLSDYNRNTETIDAAYLNLSGKSNRLTWQTGLRAEQTIMKGRQLYSSQAAVDQHYFQLFPSAFLAYTLNPHNSLNLQVSRRIDRSDYHELVPFRRPLGPTLYFEGNPYLKPTLTWHGEITWSWRNALYITVGCDLDKDYVRTIPYLDANDSTATRIPTNIQLAHSWNLDLSYNHPLTKWWTTNTTASFYENSFNGSANGENLSDPGIVSLDFNTNNSFTIGKNLNAEIDFEHETKRRFIYSTFPAYSNLTLGLRKQLPSKKITITLTARHLVLSRPTTTGGFYPNLAQYGRSFNYNGPVTLTVNYRFGSGKATQAKRRSAAADEQQRAGD